MPSFTLMSYHYVTAFVYILWSLWFLLTVSAEWPNQQYTNFLDAPYIVVITHAPDMSNYERHCAACLKSYGSKILLEQDPSGFWACPRCGLVDEGTTSARALVDFNEHGIQVDDDVRETRNPRWSDWREAKFEVSACLVLMETVYY